MLLLNALDGSALLEPTIGFTKPKRLRFLLLYTVGTIVYHARETLLRVSTALARTLYDRALIAIQVKAPDLIEV